MVTCQIKYLFIKRLFYFYSNVFYFLFKMILEFFYDLINYSIFINLQNPVWKTLQ